MLPIRNAVWIAGFLLTGALSTGCLTVAEVQIGENHKDVSHPSRNLPVRDDKPKATGGDYDTTGLWGFLGFLLMLLVALCKVCADCSCVGTRQGRVLQIPPRATDVPPSSAYNLSDYQSSLKLGSVNSSSSLAPPTTSASRISGTSLAPPRSSASIILPIEGENYPLHLYGIENPLYLPSNGKPEQGSNVLPVPEQSRQNQTPLCEILDMPPSYTTVVREEQK